VVQFENVRYGNAPASSWTSLAEARSYQHPANAFALCDLLTNGGIVSAIAKATGWHAMDDLPLGC